MTAALVVTRSQTRPSRLARRRGFTLLEVLVAAFIAAVLLLSADTAFEQLASDAHGLARTARTNDDTRNRAHLLRQLVRQIDVSASADSQARVFGGDEHSAHFTSWCLGPGGWERECHVVLQIPPDADISAGSGRVLAVTSTADTAELDIGATDMRHLGGAERAAVLRYLLDARNGGTWLVSWSDSPTVPLAIGVVRGADTAVLRIGPRG